MTPSPTSFSISISTKTTDRSIASTQCSGNRDSPLRFLIGASRAAVTKSERKCRPCSTSGRQQSVRGYLLLQSMFRDRGSRDCTSPEHRLDRHFQQRQSHFSTEVVMLCGGRHAGCLPRRYAGNVASSQTWMHVETLAQVRLGFPIPEVAFC